MLIRRGLQVTVHYLGLLGTDLERHEIGIAIFLLRRSRRLLLLLLQLRVLLLALNDGAHCAVRRARRRAHLQRVREQFCRYYRHWHGDRYGKHILKHTLHVAGRRQLHVDVVGVAPIRLLTRVRRIVRYTRLK